MSESPDAASVLADVIDKARGSMNVQTPGFVVDYDRTKQTATVQPVVMARTKDPETDVLSPLLLPILSNVPVMFPSGSGGTFSITWDLVAGDPVMLKPCDRSIDEWKAGATSPVLPRNTRRFDLSDAVAYPGTRSIAAPLGPQAYASGALVIQGNDIRQGSSAAFAFVALANLCDSRFTAIETFLATHIHAGVTTGAGSSGVAAGAPIGSTVAATKVKAE